MSSSSEEVPHLKPVAEASFRGKVSWAFFDWAAQPFATLITTFIFAPFFVTGFLGDAVYGQTVWGYVQSSAGLLIALLSPLLGAMADAGGPRKPWLFMFSIVYVCGASLLWFALPGAPDFTFVIVVTGILLATLGAEFSTVFNNAMLPDVVGKTKIGRWSGFGWGLGYLGGLASLAFILVGFVFAEVPLFGLDPAINEPDRFSGPFSAIWYVLFVIPLFLFTPDRPKSQKKIGEAFREGFSRLKQTIQKARVLKNVGRFLIARMIYQDGLTAIFAFGGIYAAGTFGWKIETLAIFGIILSVFAAPGAFLGGWLDDKIGSKPTIIIAITGLLVGTLIAVSITDTHIFFFFEVAVPATNSGPFVSVAEQAYLIGGIIIGLSGGPAQAASRTLMARLAPPDMMGEFYGLFAFSGKATAFAAPFFIALATDSFQSQRAGLVVIFAFLLVGLILFFTVKETQSRI